ncbi:MULTISPECIES: ribosomal protein S18-alanine N-acetyltransferase [Dehalococcoides]|jgi:ribosomal-protein-alanine N-acetyltransferase|uniref:ribosomal protein S18-alanine N-acetyltransferase n=1 Tax=Dehalococcoides TaxID=61434 RepID=UPI0003C827E3|nr:MULTISPECIES: ribosomal protein S18-alanine N-acetyltransferase [Dehalococcoides]AHB13318.1 ribosomal-protein acetyltransferase [Dehalococcoides mccartyi GY50]AII57747.1 alanine acetyltransferase [Dehalococcoides mccartyi CG1]APH12228.1 ribosomal-protein-alanine acetyltransferase [Dehalococcoides mccartyi]QYY58180.1 ribosomal protein S18-alanine N-acetyltransferase [Dehalococcoides mccartyi]BAQ34489.1 ribosomal-protein-alanine acetyltransferase [Dehalococcoides sp. UCH007]
MAYLIRPIKDEDIPELNQLDKEAFPTMWPATNFKREMENIMAHYMVLVDEDISTAAKPVLSIWKRLRNCIRHDTGTIQQVVDCPKVIGYGAIWVMAGSAHLVSVAVREAYRRKGFGELLLISSLKEAIKHKCFEMTLEVRVSNIVAQNLYLKYGFAIKGIRKKYYLDNHEDALIMTLDSIDSPDFTSKLEEYKNSHTRKWKTTPGMAELAS